MAAHTRDEKGRHSFEHLLGVALSQQTVHLWTLHQNDNKDAAHIINPLYIPQYESHENMLKVMQCLRCRVAISTSPTPMAY